MPTTATATASIPTTTTTTETTPMPTTAAARRRRNPTQEFTPMPTAFTASLSSAPSNDIAAPPRMGRAAQPRSNAMPLALFPPIPNAPLNPETAMPATHALKSTKTPPERITIVRCAPANSNANPQPQPQPPRPPVEAEELPLLRPSEVANVSAAEVEFYFATDHGPAVDAPDPDSDTAQARATIASWIAELAPRDQEALALYYEREPWPESILEEGLDYERGYALVLASASASHWRPRGHRRYVAEQTASEQLRAAVFDHGPRALRHLTRRAEWDFATALRAYAKARGRAPSVLGPLGNIHKEAP